MYCLNACNSPRGGLTFGKPSVRINNDLFNESLFFKTPNPVIKPSYKFVEPPRHRFSILEIIISLSEQWSSISVALSSKETRENESSFVKDFAIVFNACFTTSSILRPLDSEPVPVLISAALPMDPDTSTQATMSAPN
eukprot:NODE_306_length_11344_cov_0.675767.p9 type:complete len:138 gc:universal NODE_306_length_11344_cov_0.675767:4504-4917(+)